MTYALSVDKRRTARDVGRVPQLVPPDVRGAVLDAREEASVAAAIAKLEEAGIPYRALLPFLDEVLAGLEDEVEDAKAWESRQVPAAHPHTLRSYPKEVRAFAEWLKRRLAGYGVTEQADIQLEIFPEWLWRWGSTEPTASAEFETQVGQQRSADKRVFLALSAVPALLKYVAWVLDPRRCDDGPSYTDCALFELFDFVRSQSSKGPRFGEFSVIFEEITKRHFGVTPRPAKGLGDPDALKMREARLRKRFIDGDDTTPDSCADPAGEAT